MADASTRIGDRLGPFTLEAVLGEGGMGIVYRATRESPAQTVAVKVLKQALSSDEIYRRRFEREAQVAREVRHRHLVPVVESGDDRGVRYLAMAYVDGRSLAELLAVGPLSIAEAVRIVSEVASGVDALHAHELVHRDVKPSNIMLAHDGAALLTDFGLARGRALTVLTRPGEVMGTLDYMAPDHQRRDGQPCQRHLRTGMRSVRVFGRGSAFLQPRHVREGRRTHRRGPPDPAGMVDRISHPLAWGLLRGLAKPTTRPTTARAYARMLALGAQA